MGEVKREAQFCGELMLIHLNKRMEGRPPIYVRSEQFIDLVYVFLAISEGRTRTSA